MSKYSSEFKLEVIKYYLENNVGYDFVSGCKLANKVAAEVVQIQGAKLSKECFDKFKV